MNFESYKQRIQEEGLSENDYIIGIDLGTTHSVISYWNASKQEPEPIDMSHGFGKVPMPSVVQLRKEELEEEWIVGEEALSSYLIYPESTVLSVKSRMGSNDVITLEHQEFSPEELSAKILATLMDQVSTMNPKSVCVGVVVSVPYDFDDAGKKAVLRSCRLAGFHEQMIGLIEEPKAAALAYNRKHPFKEGETLMVFDFGGGTLDITLFQVAHLSEKEQVLRVLSEGGEAHHGGDLIDQLLYEYFIDVMKDKGIDTEALSKESLAEMKVRSKETKERLSGAQKVRVPFTYCIPPFVLNLKRETFLELIDGFVAKTRHLIHRTLQEAYDGAVQFSQVDRILLEGGSSQMPWVKDMMVELFQDESKIYMSERPALDISLGACIYAAMEMDVHEQKDIITGLSVVDFDVCVPHDIGFEIDVDAKKRFYPMIHRGTPYRLAKRSQIFTLSGDTEQDMTSLNVRIMERIHKEKDLEGCSLIGDVAIEGLPKRPSGQTQVKVELSIEKQSGTVKGHVEDMGYKGIHLPSGFKESFIPKRFEPVTVTETEGSLEER